MFAQWDDPFEVRQKPTIITQVDVADVDIDFIRNQQAALLPLLSIFRASAEASLTDAAAQRILPTKVVNGVAIFFRLPDQPHLINYYTQDVADTAVPVLMHKMPPMPILDRIFPVHPAQKIVRAEPPLPRIELPPSLIRLGASEITGQPDCERIIYPKLADYIATWIKQIEGPITDIKVMPGRSSLRANASVVIDLASIHAGGPAVN